jgi:hypothetical protein
VTRSALFTAPSTRPAAKPREVISGVYLSALLYMLGQIVIENRQRMPFFCAFPGASAVIHVDSHHGPGNNPYPHGSDQRYRLIIVCGHQRQPPNTAANFSLLRFPPFQAHSSMRWFNVRCLAWLLSILFVSPLPASAELIAGRQ